MAQFGKTTTGASTQSYTTNRKLVSKHTLSENALLTSLTARMRNNNTTQTRNWRGVIYADAAGSPGALLHVTSDGTIASSTVAALTANFADQTLAAGDYWIGVQHDSNATTSVLLHRDNTPASGVSANDTFSDGAANPFGVTGSNSGPFDVYVTYTPDTGTPTPPAAPSGLSATAIDDERIDLAWTDNSSGGSQEANFLLERKTGSGGTYTQISTPAQDAQTYSDTGLTPETEYFYRIKATNTGGDSSYATEVFATTYEVGYVPRWLATIQGWIYPGSPAEDADEEYHDARIIHTLKPEYFRIHTDGTLTQVNDPGDGENGYSSANASDVKAYSSEQYITVAGNAATMHALTSNPTNYATAITTLVNFCVSIGFTGVELDWEGYGSWTTTSYANYKLFVEDLADAVHIVGKKLMILGPPISNSTEQGYYEWHYEDFETSNVDCIGVMAYDYQWDWGGGSPVAPTTWVQNICDWVKSRISDVDRIVMGMNSYGYVATSGGGYDVEILTGDEATAKPGYGTATLDVTSNEMKWVNGGKYYCYVDAAGMDAKRQVIEDKGIRHISVWHLGGNDWFTSTKAEPLNDVDAPDEHTGAFFGFF